MPVKNFDEFCSNFKNVLNEIDDKTLTKYGVDVYNKNGLFKIRIRYNGTPSNTLNIKYPLYYLIDKNKPQHKLLRNVILSGDIFLLLPQLIKMSMWLSTYNFNTYLSGSNWLGRIFVGVIMLPSKIITRLKNL